MVVIQKEYTEINSYFIKANEKIDSGDVESALEYVKKLEESKEKNLANYYLAPLYRYRCSERRCTYGFKGY